MVPAAAAREAAGPRFFRWRRRAPAAGERGGDAGGLPGAWGAPAGRKPRGAAAWAAAGEGGLGRPRPEGAGLTGLAAGPGTNGTFVLVLLNMVVFGLGFAVPWLSSTLALSHWAPSWWQFATSLFVHRDWAHLTDNLFLLYMFGRIVEEEEGFWGVLVSYLICGLGANIASILLLPKNVVSESRERRT